MSCVEQPEGWQPVETGQLYSWRYEGDPERYSVSIDRGGDGFSVSYDDRREIATAVGYNWVFGDERSAFRYALDLMDDFAENSGNIGIK